MDRNTLIGFGLIFVILIGFWFYTKPTEKELAIQKKQSDSIEQVALLTANKAKQTDSILANKTTIQDTSQVNSKLGGFKQTNTVAKEVVIKNKDVAITLTSKGGFIKQVELLNYKKWDKSALKMLDAQSKFYLEFKTAKGAVKSNEVEWQLMEATANQAVFRLPNTNGGFIEQKISLPSAGFVTDYKITLNQLQNDIYRGSPDINLVLNPALRVQEKLKKIEFQKSTINYKIINEEPNDLGSGTDNKEDLKDQLQWLSFSQQYFNFTIASPTAFAKDAKLVMDEAKSDSIVRFTSASAYLPYNMEPFKEYNFKLYTGPSDYKSLKALNLGVENHNLQEIIPLGWGIFGWINRVAVMPIFDILTNNIVNTGLAILLLTLIVKFILLPLVYKSYISTAKMRLLKPEIEAIKAKIPNDLQKQQQENMALYKKAGVSPMSGCIPLLFQMPVLFAMFQFFPSAFQLRQKPFLWSTDLSAYDSILDFGFNIPFYGDHISLFTLLMTISTLVYTHFNNQISGVTGQMKWIGYMMPIIFLGVLNDFASGLTWYYLVSNLITFGQQWVIKQRVDDNKLRTQIAESRKKPVVKSKFQARMEDAMRQQQNRKKK